jgi:2-alkenal reductase
VRRVVPALIAEGTYVYPYIGIGTSGFPIDLDRQEALDLPQASGVYVTRVTPDSPAEEAGIIAAPSAQAPGGDLIVAVDGNEVKEFEDLISYLVFETEVGQTIELTVIRDGEEMTIPLTLAERP